MTFINGIKQRLIQRLCNSTLFKNECKSLVQDYLNSLNLVSTQLPYFNPGILDRNNIGQLILHDRIERPNYALCVWLATIQAAKLEISKIHIIEFGCAYGDGLINLCKIADVISKSTDIQFEITGFDSDCGMPELIDYRDHPEIWKQGQFLSDHDKIRKQLPDNAILVSGNIKDTLNNFMEKITPKCPLGFVSVDVDIYSSAVECLKIFNLDNPICYLPSTIVYFDDINDQLTNNLYTGEELAISEFNNRNTTRKLQMLPVRQNHPPRGWHDQIYALHVLNHPVRTGEYPCGLLHNINITAL
jgi:hypothetical protein